MGWGQRDRAGERPAWRVLLLEDDPGDVDIVRAYLRELDDVDVELEAVARMSDALRRLQDADYDLLLVDLKLPDVDGPEVVSGLARASRGRPIVVLTDTTNHDFALDCLAAGAHDFLAKESINARSLRRSMGYAIARARAEELRQRLDHADRLTSLGQFASSVANEIRSPAARALGDLRAALGELGDAGSSVAKARVHASVQEVERVVAIARDLESFARADGEIGWIDLGGLIEDAERNLAFRLRGRATVTTELGELPAIAGFGRSLSRVVVNLVENAIESFDEAAGAPGQVTISARLAADARVIIAIEDTGRGIAAEDLARIFEPYFTTKGSDRTGLGLAICDEIVRQHGGKLTVSSTAGEGSRFVIELPRDTGLAPLIARRDRTTPPPDDAPSSAPARMRVLVIDDEPLLIKSFTRMLRTQHTVTTALGGAEALTLLERDDRFDAVLCDLMMPGVDGIEIFAAIGERHPHLASKLVFLTGGVFTDRVDDFLNDFDPPLLEKPVSMKKLLSVVTDLGR